MKPHAITSKEWARIIKVRDVIEGWGFTPDEGPELAASMIYGVRFDFVSDGPGYIGPLYLLQGAGDPGTAPVALIEEDGELAAL